MAMTGRGRWPAIASTSTAEGTDALDDSRAPAGGRRAPFPPRGDAGAGRGGTLPAQWTPPAARLLLPHPGTARLLRGQPRLARAGAVRGWTRVRRRAHARHAADGRRAGPLRRFAGAA